MATIAHRERCGTSDFCLAPWRSLDSPLGSGESTLGETMVVDVC